MPMPSASDELKASTRSMPGWWASSRCFTGSLHMAPDEIDHHERAQVPPARVLVERGRAAGGEKGSPTMTRPLTFSRSMVSSSSTGSYLRDSSRQTRPPSASTVLAVKSPVPCMSGQAGSSVTPPGLASSAAAHGLEAAVDVVVAHAAVDQAGEEVVLAPHDALGHAGRAAGVEHVEVVAAAAPRRAHPADGGLGRVLVGRGPVGARARAVVDPEPALHAGHAIEDALDPLGERAVEDDGHGVGVVPQVAQLVVAVAVVGVDGDQADLDGGEGGLQVLGRVVEVDRHLVLLRRRRGRAGTARCRRRRGRTRSHAHVAAALGDGDGVGLHVRHRLPDVCVVPVGHASLRSLDPPTSPHHPDRPTRPHSTPAPAEMREARR